MSGNSSFGGLGLRGGVFCSNQLHSVIPLVFRRSPSQVACTGKSTVHTPTPFLPYISLQSLFPTRHPLAAPSQRKRWDRPLAVTQETQAGGGDTAQPRSVHNMRLSLAHEGDHDLNTPEPHPSAGPTRPHISLLQTRCRRTVEHGPFASTTTPPQLPPATPPMPPRTRRPLQPRALPLANVTSACCLPNQLSVLPPAAFTPPSSRLPCSRTP